MSEPKRYRYMRSALVKDYLLASAGLALGLLPFVLAEPGRIAGAILAAIGMLATFLLLRTVRRHAAVFVLGAKSLSAGGRPLAWRELAGLRLRHFATRRDQPGGGWMELRLRGAGQRITVDSGLDGFSDILRAAHAAALANGVKFDPVTAANLTAFGLAIPREEI
ncbi:MAG: hypothetical protein OEO83_13545 [Alphaproteobacteria bacterium]|nr:hypothetical protein [Alphaproteobacteria bacterium]